MNWSIEVLACVHILSSVSSSAIVVRKDNCCSFIIISNTHFKASISAFPLSVVRYPLCVVRLPFSM